MFPWLKQVLAFERQPDFNLGEAANEEGQTFRGDDKQGGRVKGGDRVAPDFEVFTPDTSLDTNEQRLRAAFHSPMNKDFVVRKIQAGKSSAMLCYIEGMCDKLVINDLILRALLEEHRSVNLQTAMDKILPVNDVKMETDGATAVRSVLDGLALLFIDGEDSFLIMETRKYEKRSVSAPQNEKTVRGPQQGFIEDLRTNINLLRNLVRVPELVTTYYPTGGDNNLKCAMLYRDGVTPQKLVDEIASRLQRISDSGGFILGSMMLDGLLEERRHSLFPQTLQTERPDRAASFLSQGYIVVIAEGNPSAMVLPATFFALMHTSEDAMLRSLYTNVFRILRYSSLLITLLLPGLYLALMTYHSDIVPVEFLITTLSQRQMVGMPILAELIIMGFIFEFVREASIRVQSGVSQTLGIIGALILGQAAISSNIVSPIVTIIIGLTGICSFAIPNYTMQIAAYTIRLGFILLASFSGFSGMTIGLICLVAYLSQLTCYGVPFFAPFAPKVRSNTDNFMRSRNVQTDDIPDFMNVGEGE